MSEHSECPNCNCTSRGKKIYRCRKCGTVYCASCGKYKGMPFLEECRCPDCEGLGGVIGRIDSDD